MARTKKTLGFASIEALDAAIRLGAMVAVSFGREHALVYAIDSAVSHLHDVAGSLNMAGGIRMLPGCEQGFAVAEDPGRLVGSRDDALALDSIIAQEDGCLTLGVEDFIEKRLQSEREVSANGGR